MKKVRIDEHGELWVLVEVFIGPCGFVAHWFSHSGVNKYELINVVFNKKKERSVS